MTADNTAKVNGRAPKATSQKTRSSSATKASPAKVTTATDTDPTVQPDNVKTTGGEAMSTDNVVQIMTRPNPEDKSQASAIELHQPHKAEDGPLMPSEFEVAETVSVAGIRPIAASHLELAGSFMNGRPIAASSLTVYEMLPGDRPVFSSQVKMVEGASLMGNRPIMVSDPHLLEASLLPGNRPIASNEIDNPESLMGFLD